MRFIIPKANIKIFHKAVQSLAKFGDLVYFEPLAERLSLKAFNSSRSAFAIYSFSAPFFSSIEGEPPREENGEVLRCKIMIRSLLLPFHSIHLTEKIAETGILDISDTNKLAVILHCRYEVRRSFLLPVLESEAVSLTYSTRGASTWTAHAKVLADVVGNFLPSQDEATMTVLPDRFRMKNYVDSYEDKEQIYTDFSMLPGEFENYNVQSETALTFCLKEFRSIISFAEFTVLPITAHFDSGGQPIVFTISQEPLLEVVYVLATLVEGPTANTDPARQRLPLSASKSRVAGCGRSTGTPLRRVHSTQKEMAGRASLPSTPPITPIPINPLHEATAYSGTVDMASPNADDSMEMGNHDHQIPDQPTNQEQLERRLTNQKRPPAPDPIDKARQSPEFLASSPGATAVKKKQRTIFSRVFSTTYLPQNSIAHKKVLAQDSDPEED